MSISQASRGRHSDSLVSQSSRELTVLKELIRDVHRISDTTDLLDSILLRVRRHFAADVSTICAHEGKGRFRLLGRNHKKDTDRSRLRLASEKCGAFLCAGFLPSAGSPCHFEDLRSHSSLRETCLGSSAVRSCVCIPVHGDNALLGGICVGSFTKNPRQFVTSHPASFRALAEITAIAIERRKEAAAVWEPAPAAAPGFPTGSSPRVIIGRDEKLQSIRKTIRSVAMSDATVLILGETGTGKELVAHAIHDSGPRASRRFVSQNCAALPESLLESELFGHTRGAFTGAVASKMGLFEVADRGTLFLDEIADLSSRMQAALLRVLEDGEVRRLGEMKSRRVSSRLIAATSGDLERLVEAGSFRRELFYRLNVVAIRLPALRHRRGDIPLLAQHFVSRYSPLSGKGFTALDARALSALERYDWPGNIRELENEIHRAIILSEPGKLLRLDALSEKFHKLPVETGGADGRDESLRAVEARHILRILRDSGGTISKAAARLRIHRNTLTRKVSELGIRTQL